MNANKLIDILDTEGLDEALDQLKNLDGYDKEKRLFAVFCARRVQHLMKDERSIKALDVSERYAHGEATEEELADAMKETKAAWVASARAALATEAEATRAAEEAAAEAALVSVATAAYTAEAWAAEAARAATGKAAWATEAEATRATRATRAAEAAWAADYAAQEAEFRRLFGGKNGC